MANRATGKGYENESFYENIKFNFFGIENIHVMRASLTKVIESKMKILQFSRQLVYERYFDFSMLTACDLKSSSVNAFLNGIDASNWLKHIKALLDAAWFIADAVDKGISVVVHCSDGWDRTAQVCSLAALLLDPYYRTIQGYQVFIVLLSEDPCQSLIVLIKINFLLCLYLVNFKTLPKKFA